MEEVEYSKVPESVRVHMARCNFTPEDLADGLVVTYHDIEHVKKVVPDAPAQASVEDPNFDEVKMTFGPNGNANELRADWAQIAVDTFVDVVGMDENVQDNVRDLLIDIAHLCDRHELSFSKLVFSALSNYEEELAEAPPAASIESENEGCGQECSCAEPAPAPAPALAAPPQETDQATPSYGPTLATKQALVDFVAKRLGLPEGIVKVGESETPTDVATNMIQALTGHPPVTPLTLVDLFRLTGA